MKPDIAKEVLDLGFGPFRLGADLHRLVAVHGLGAHEATALYCGRILEAISSVAVEALELEAGIAFANLTVLEQTEFLHRPSLDWAHALRRMGNDARHLRRQLGSIDGDLALAFVDRWVGWFFREFARRPASPAPDALPRIGSPEVHGLLDELSRPPSEIRAVLDRSPLLAAVRAERLIDAGRHEDADQVLVESLRHFPGDGRLNQLRGLGFSRRGAPEDLEAAEALLAPLAGRGGGDEEFTGILAGVLRRQWRLRQDSSRLERAARLYQSGFRASGGQNVWLGTSAAACELLLGRPASALERARRICALLDQRHRLAPDAVPSYWLQATRAEAFLLARRFEEAWTAYRLALGRPGVPSGQIQSTRAQLADLLPRLGIASAPEEWLGAPVHEPLRIGVVGHRRLEQVERLRQDLRRALERIRETWNGRPLVLVSSLAEGADRLFVEVGRDDPFRGTLEAILPLLPEEYRRDFVDPGSRSEFDRFLESAHSVRLAPGVESLGLQAPGARALAYGLGGRAVVDVSDVLVAVWDGHPARGRGGTAETVSLARSRGTPLAWVHAGQPRAVTYERWPGHDA
ncbi:MAG TPA: tetratricopeptide repeat-containing protein [Myxococcaceae bacterium]|nr:tetratricopeptide repeat-containing protein [Myxococcaceae bacterium]